MNTNDKVEAIALCRVSTTKQSEEGTSLEAQEQRVYDAAMHFNAEIVKFWSIARSSRKGKNYQRKDLVEMLAFAKANKKVKYIIVDEPDRFMRDFKTYFYWQVKFQEEAGLKMVYAKKPHLAEDDSMMSLMEEMMDVFRAEASNQERINKSTPNMQARVALGFYPGRPKPGYQHTNTRGLYEPKQPEWSLIKESFLAVLSGATVKETVANLAAQGYRANNGKPIDTYKFKKLMKDPYYAGIIAMSNWEVNANGLHKPMVTIEQHQELSAIAEGVVYKPRKQFNAEYPLSKLMSCTDCLKENGKYPKLVGFTHSNGKGNVYKRYKCRECGKMIRQEELHEKLNSTLEAIRISDDKKDDFLAALRAVWEQDSTLLISRTKALQTRLEHLKQEKNTAVRNALNASFNEDVIRGVLDNIDKEINEVNDELASIQQIEKDFIEFVTFSIDFIENLRLKFWELDAENIAMCKQLLFPDGFSVSRDKKVYTPKISDIYRVMHKEKIPADADISYMAGVEGFEPPNAGTRNQCLTTWRHPIASNKLYHL